VDEIGGARRTHWKDDKTCRIFIGKPGGKKHAKDPGIDGKIILEWILGK
jgi:hypothetical protein